MPLITALGIKLPIPPAFNKPNKICKIPANTIAAKKVSKLPSFDIELNTIAVNPAAGPDTLNFEPLNAVVTIPPITPEIIPENIGTPQDSAIPIQSGSATKKTTMPAFTSALSVF
jgi:hypothetical protein